MRQKFWSIWPKAFISECCELYYCISKFGEGPKNCRVGVLGILKAQHENSLKEIFMTCSEIHITFGKMICATYQLLRGAYPGSK